MGLCLVACEARGTEGLTTLGRPPVRVGFVGCHVPVDPGHRWGRYAGATGSQFSAPLGGEGRRKNALTVE